MNFKIGELNFENQDGKLVKKKKVSQKKGEIFPKIQRKELKEMGYVLNKKGNPIMEGNNPVFDSKNKYVLGGKDYKTLYLKEEIPESFSQDKYNEVLKINDMSKEERLGKKISNAISRFNKRRLKLRKEKDIIEENKKKEKEKKRIKDRRDINESKCPEVGKEDVTLYKQFKLFFDGIISKDQMPKYVLEYFNKNPQKAIEFKKEVDNFKYRGNFKKEIKNGKEQLVSTEKLGSIEVRYIIDNNSGKNSGYYSFIPNKNNVFIQGGGNRISVFVKLKENLGEKKVA